MSSAVQALIDGHTPTAQRGRRSAYRTWCACCDAEPEVPEGKRQRQAHKRPVLAWRTRLATQQALDQRPHEPKI